MDNKKIIFLVHDLINNLQIAKAKLGKLETKNTKELSALNSSIQRMEERLSVFKQYELENENNKTVIGLGDGLVHALIQSNELKKIFGIEVDLHFDLDGKEQRVEICLKRLKAFRENVIGNAVNAGATRVDIFYKTNETFLESEYRDNGSGFCETILEKLNTGKRVRPQDQHKHIGTEIIKDFCNEHNFEVEYGNHENGGLVRLKVPYV